MAITLNVEKRDIKADLEALKKSGKIPAVFYGKKEQSTPIAINLVDFIKVYKEAGESTVVNIKGNGIDVDSIIHDMQLHPLTNKPVHVDFYVFEKGKKVKVNVPVNFIGNAPAVKELGGILVKVLHDIEIEALPKDLPHSINVDISNLTSFNSTIEAKDIVLPSGVTLITGKNDIVASISQPKEEKEETAPVDFSTIEVAKKGKEAKEGEAEVEDSK